MRDLIQPVEKRRLADEVTDQIKALLVARNLAPGERLPSERELAELFRVGRSSIREAIRNLDALGIVEVRPGEGLYVKSLVGGSYLKSAKESLSILLELDEGILFEILEWRFILETKTAYLATKNATEEDLGLLEAAFLDLVKHLGDHAYSEKDLEFHKAIARCTHNRVLVHLTELNSGLLARFNRRFLDVPHVTAIFHPDHERIFASIRKHAPRQAETAMRAHLQHAADFLKRMLARKPEDARPQADRRR